MAKPSKRIRIGGLIGAAAFSTCAGAQVVPSAGSLLQAPKPVPQLPSKELAPFVQLPAGAPVAPGGRRVLLSSLAFEGNHLFTTAQLVAALGPVTGKEYDLAGLRALALRVQAYYRAHGYPFTQVLIPPQNVQDGKLLLRVLEGSYGRVRAAGQARWANGAQPFLDAELHPGAPISNQVLERTMLILNDQPGIKVTPVLRPGQGVGEGDLQVGVERTKAYGGDVTLDNAGNRYTGQYEARVSVYANDPFLFGDRFQASLQDTNGHNWLGSLHYELPVAHQGLRASLDYSRDLYQVGSQFSSLGAYGHANVAGVKLSYPLVRSQATNLLLGVGLQHKSLQDDYGAVGTVIDKQSRLLPVSLQFDHRDALGGGGITYGLATFSLGQLSLDATQTALDAQTAKTAGSFSKFDLDVARIQRVTDKVSVYGRYSYQWANKNLDASEQFGLGGFYGVRAYPLGEGLGTKGWLAQLELRRSFGQYTPFLFYDAGSITVNVDPWDANSAQTRRIGGVGAGLRATWNRLSIDSALAWRTQGGPSTSDTRDLRPRLWVSANYRF